MKYLLPLCVLAAPAVAQEIPAPEKFAEARAWIEGAIERNRVPGLSVAVVEDGEIVWAEGFGWADVEKEIPATADTVYPLGEISELCTAAGLSLLVDRGIVDLDEPVNRYLGEAKLRSYPPGEECPTVGEVVGDEAYFAYHSNLFFGDDRPPSLDETIARHGFTTKTRRYRMTKWEAEETGVGFVVLARILELASGESWDTFLQESVFAPHRMAATGDLATAAALAAVYDRKDRQFVRIEAPRTDNPAGLGLCSSAADLARFVAGQIDDGIFEDALGWWWDTSTAPESFYAESRRPWANGSIFVQPERDRGFVTLTNATTSASRRLHKLLRDALDVRKAEPNDDWKPAVGYSSGGGAGGVFLNDPLAGVWHGTIRTPSGDVDVRLEVGESECTLVSNRQSIAKGSPSVRTGSSLYVDMPPTPDAPSLGFRRVPAWHVKLSGTDVLTGVAYAVADGHFKLAHYVELERVEGR